MHVRHVLLSVAIAVALPLAAQPCKPGFSAPDRAITASVDSAAWADFNQDGRVDVAFTTIYSLAVSLNRGNGVFEPVSTERLPAPFSSSHIRGTMDVDRDGHTDLLFGMSNFGTTIDGWAHGRGDGTFAEPVRLDLSDAIFDGARLYDFDRDGFRDIVAYTRHEVHFFRSEEDARFTFTRSIRFADELPMQQESIRAGDFDGDGSIDAVRIAYDLQNGRWLASVIWSASAATPASDDFELPYTLEHTFEPIDLDRDGEEELLGMTEGLFILHFHNRELTQETLPFPHVPGATPRHPAVADVDRDGRLDLVFSYGRTVAVARGNATTRFSEPLLFGFGGSYGFALADVNADGAADIAATQGGEGLSVLYAGSAIAPAAPQRVFPLEFAPRRLLRADINGDGQPDVVAGDGESMTVSVLLNDRGTFRRTSTIRYGPSNFGSLISRVFVADFDGDGFADVAAGAAEESSVRPAVGFGDGQGNFTAVPFDPAGARLIGALRTSAGPASLLVRHEREIRALQITRTGAITTSVLFTVPEDAVGIVTFDLDGDSLDEIAVESESGIDILQLSGGTWQKVHELRPSFSHLAGITVADLNGDHVSDLLLMFESDVRIDFRTGSGFGNSEGVGGRGFVDDVDAGDVDRDGHLDLIVATRGNFGDPGVLHVQRNDGTGRFSPYNTSLTTPPYGWPGFAADVDGDGAIDVVRPSFDGVELHRNVCVTPRVRVAVVPPRVTTGNRAKLVIHALSTDAFAIGSVTVKQNGVIVDSQQPHLAYDYATFVWISEPLAKGRYTFTIEYEDQYAGPSSTEVVVDVEDGRARRRGVRH